MAISKLRLVSWLQQHGVWICNFIRTQASGITSIERCLALLGVCVPSLQYQGPRSHARHGVNSKGRIQCLLCQTLSSAVTFVGRCAEFAFALSRLSGKPLYGMFDGAGAMHHVFVADKGGILAYDIRGEMPMCDVSLGLGLRGPGNLSSRGPRMRSPRPMPCRPARLLAKPKPLSGASSQPGLLTSPCAPAVPSPWSGDTEA